MGHRLKTLNLGLITFLESAMKMIVGLGNPGRKYNNTRHNVGFKVLEEFAGRFLVEKEESRCEAIIGHTRPGGQKTLLVKPLTYMNNSGQAVAALVKWYKIELENLIVVYDDMDLAPGSLRLRAEGGSGGHKGVTSIIDRLGSRQFSRLRLGIGRPDREAVDWVLGEFTPEETDVMNKAVRRAADALEYWIRHGIVQTMNEYN